MSDLYLHDIEDGESPDAYLHMKWLTHHRYLKPVKPDRDLIAETISDAKGTERVTDEDYKWADHIIKRGWRADDE